jgi:hypothetical protein
MFAGALGESTGSRAPRTGARAVRVSQVPDAATLRFLDRSGGGPPGRVGVQVSQVPDAANLRFLDRGVDRAAREFQGVGGVRVG